MSIEAASVKAFADNNEARLNASQHAATGQRHDRILLEEPVRESMPPVQQASINNNNNITVTQRMVSATIGSVFTSLLVTPLDVVRVRLQSQNPTPTPSPLNLSRFPGYQANFAKLPPDLGVKACCREVFWLGNNGQFCLASTAATAEADAAAIAGTDCAVEEIERRTFNSTLDGLRKIARNEGPTTLWRGLSPTLLMAIPANVIYFTGYDWLRYNQASPIRAVSNDTYNPLISGSIARVLAAIAVGPIEMFRTRMQSVPHEKGTSIFRQTMLDMAQLTQTQGYTSLWRGLTLTMWRDVPFSAFYWWGYEATRNSIRNYRYEGRMGTTLIPTVQQQMERREDNFSTTFIDSFAAGSAAGAVAALVTTPFDVGKTRQQVYRYAGDDVVVVKKPSQVLVETAGGSKVVAEELSMPRFLFHIFKEEGISGLFRGWAPRCLKVAPACAIMISSYELGKRWAREVNQTQEEAQ